MKKYVLDTNIVLRYLVRDNEELYLKSLSYFTQANKGEIVFRILPEMIFEVEYVLRKYYHLQPPKISEALLSLMRSSFVECSEKDVCVKALKTYSTKNIDLFDTYLYEYHKKYNIEILTFDKDFKKFTG